MGILLTATHRTDATKARRHHFVCDRATVGRGENVDLSLADVNPNRIDERISLAHARFHWHGTHLSIVDLTRTSTYVNGVAVGRDTVGQGLPVVKLSLFDVVRIADWEIRFTRDDLSSLTTTRRITDPRERDLLEALRQTPNADDVRQVYGDWLEEHGRIAEAELLTIERTMFSLPPTDPRYLQLEAERRAIAANLGSIWKCIVTRLRVSGCVPAATGCGQTWDQLSKTNEERIRRCTSCRKSVYFVTDTNHASRRMSRGQRVVIDPSDPINDGG